MLDERVYFFVQENVPGIVEHVGKYDSDGKVPATRVVRYTMTADELRAFTATNLATIGAAPTAESDASQPTLLHDRHHVAKGGSDTVSSFSSSGRSSDRNVSSKRLSSLSMPSSGMGASRRAL